MFVLMAAAMIGGIAAGLLARGSFERLTEIKLRSIPLLLVLLVIGMLPLFFGFPSGLRQTIQIVSMLGVSVFLAVNIAATRGGVRTGLLVAGIGWLLNFVVIAANGGMPLSLWAWERSGQSGAPTPGEGGFFKIVLADDDTVLRFLGDVIPVRFLSQVLSIGDFVLVAGIAIVIAAGMRSGARGGEPAAA